jgi:uncharacterized protein (TIGR03086 family)
VSTESLEQAFASTRGVLANVGRDQLDASTPCRLWTVHQLINHLVGAPRVAAGRLRAEEGGSEDEDFVAGDFRKAYDVSAREALAAFGSEGALEKTVALPFAEIPARFLLAMVTTDQFIHGWDLARATGQSTDLDPDLASRLLAHAAVPDQFRGEEGTAPFGPVQQAPAGAVAADLLAAHLGREV